ncbi:MAG: hypothetical protein GY835_03200, partial [bacterium]|nr:hypothetical protein [bacterium]
FSGPGAIEHDQPSGSLEQFYHGYGDGDQLESMTRGSQGQVRFTSGSNGRTTGRDGVDFAYDAAGRRTEDDRYTFIWDWRGRLYEINVKDEWPANPNTQPNEPIIPAFAGHQVRFEYDGLGRLESRIHFGPEEDGERPLYEKRVFLWEGSSLLAEIAYDDLAETSRRWRKTYVPGTTGLDDAIQVRIETTTPPSDRVYTFSRDELGTVLAVLMESDLADPDFEVDPGNPLLLLRYVYTPFGEVHVETGPELRAAGFSETVISVETDAGEADQV